MGTCVWARVCGHACVGKRVCVRVCVFVCFLKFSVCCVCVLIFSECLICCAWMRARECLRGNASECMRARVGVSAYVLRVSVFLCNHPIWLYRPTNGPLDGHMVLWTDRPSSPDKRTHQKPGFFCFWQTHLSGASALSPKIRVFINHVCGKIRTFS